MSAFDCLVTIGAKTGTQRCQVATWLYMPLAACPVPFSAKMRMLIAIAIVPRHSKARTMSTRRSFRCCKSGLAVFFLAMVRQQYFEPLDLAQLWDLMADILWSFRLFFFTVLKDRGLTYVERILHLWSQKLGHPEIGSEHGAFRRFLQVSVDVKGESGRLNDFTFGPCGGKCLVFFFVGNDFFFVRCSLTNT